jgi:hypothetical protein
MPLDSPVQAQEQPRAGRKYDIGLAPGVGYFLDSQQVDQGYYINGRSYHLVWSGLQLQLSGDVHWYLAPSFGLGVAAAFLIAPNPTGADQARTVEMDPGRIALGGYLALSACFRSFESWRLSTHAGYGSNGVPGTLGFGGRGFVMGASAHRLLGTGKLATGVGLRWNLMGLWSAHAGDVQGEASVYLSLLFEVLLDVDGRRGP